MDHIINEVYGNKTEQSKTIVRMPTEKCVLKVLAQCKKKTLPRAI